MPPHWLRYIPLYLPWLALLGWLASLSWFLTDDAFITFRYARNLLAGHGLVFNPGEYVEGYSNFLWLLELAAIWAVSGIAPEYTAQWLSVAFTAATLAAMLWWLLKLPGLPHRALTIWMALGFLCSSATFATWTSGGGLETRQFTFFILLTVVCLSLYRERTAGLLTASFSLAAAAYTRPEGPLIALVCFAWFPLQRLADAGRPAPNWHQLRQIDWRGLACLSAPCLILIAAYFLFRYAYYGEWLPNTYYAKYVRPWYEMGFIYLWSAALETGLYLLLPLACIGLRQQWHQRRDSAYALTLLLIAFHALYLLRVGGDRFEHRPLDFYWPLLAVPAAQGIACLGAALLPWLRSFAPPLPLLGTQLCILLLFLPILFYANAMQAALSRIAGDYPELTSENAPWLLATPGMTALNAIASELRRQTISRGVARRTWVYQHYPQHYIPQWQPYQAMERGLIPDDALTASGQIGVKFYYLPDLRVIDTAGLTDYAIARNPVLKPNRERRMAVDRDPPPGYLTRRGANFTVYPAAYSIQEALALNRGEFALRVGTDLYLPFDAPSRQWVADRFAGRQWHSRQPYIDRLLTQLQASPPALTAPFAVYLTTTENLLLYLHPAECTAADLQSWFFLHIEPVDPVHLPLNRRQHGFDNLDFTFHRLLSDDQDGGRCITAANLPDYPIAAIRTGQFVDDAKLWEGEIRLNPK